MKFKQALVKYAFNNFWPGSFKRTLKTHLEAKYPAKKDKLFRQIEGRARKARLEYQYLATDNMTDSFVSTCSIIIGAYEVLLDEMDSSQEVIEFLRHNFKHTAQTQVKLYYRVMLNTSKDKLQTMENMFVEGMPLYGNSFNYEMVSIGDSKDAGIGCHISKCFFHDFFTAYGIAELTTVLCHWDENWLDEIVPEKDGIEYCRPTTLGYGGEKCRFEFREVK